MNLARVKGEGQRFSNVDYSVLKFWLNRNRQHPAFYVVTACVLATSVSSSATERVLPAVKLLVNESQSRLLSNILEDIIVIRSLTEQFLVWSVTKYFLHVVAFRSKFAI